MNTTRIDWRSAGLAAVLSLVPMLRAAPAAPNWQPLFNGRDLAGWVVPSPNPYWRVEQGVLVGESDEKLTGSMLRTEKKFGDFVFEADVRWQGDPDSGVFMRTPALQVQIGTSISQKRDLTGSFYLGGYPEHAQAKDAAKYLKKPGEWNNQEIRADRRHIRVTLNGSVIVDANLDKVTDPEVLREQPGLQRSQGHVGFLGHSSRIEFRNLRIKELK